MNKNNKNVFISYAHADIHRVRIIVDILNAFHFNPWFDHHLIVGKRWKDQLIESICSCEFFLFALSPNSAQSNWCQWEYKQAVIHQKAIVPVVITPIDFRNLPEEIAAIAEIQAVDFTKGPKHIATTNLLYGIHSYQTISTEDVSKIEAPHGEPERYQEPDQNERQLAQRIYEKVSSNDLETKEAIELLQSCLKHNPYHSEAQRLLAQLELQQEITVGDNLLSQPIEWIPIPGGTMRVKNDSLPYLHDLIAIPSFEISKYPITDGQYVDFLNADDGYVNIACWDYSQAAKAWRHEGERVARRSKFKGDDLPRVNISWYDAVAFCQWLSRKTGQNITLPTSLQWQRAARDDTNYTYPWGNRWNWHKCNSSVHQVSTGTKQVAAFSAGASPYGVMDMCGNVWEWTHLVDENQNIRLEGDKERWLHGGSWKTKDRAQLAIDSSRLHPTPRDATDDIGFRVVRLSKH